MGRSELNRAAKVCASATLAAVLAGAPGHARAQTAESKVAAESAFEEGKRLMMAHAYAEACPKFLESIRHEPGIGAMLGLADCYEKNGQTASAWAEFREAASTAGRKSDPRQALARSNTARLEPMLTKLVVHVPPETETSGLVVKRDGVEVGRATWEEAVPVDPGAHAISASAPGFKDWQTTIEAPASAGVQTITIPRLEHAPSPPPAPSPPQPAASAPSAMRTPPPRGDEGHTQRIAGVAVAGVGVVGLAVGAILGGVAKSKLDQSNSGGHCDVNDSCDGPGLSLRRDAESAATGATIAFVVGGIALAGGGVLWFTAPRATSGGSASGPRVRLGAAPSPGGLSLRGEW
jgi:serine/threonine-protein kinase